MKTRIASAIAGILLCACLVLPVLAQGPTGNTAAASPWTPRDMAALQASSMLANDLSAAQTPFPGAGGASSSAPLDTLEMHPHILRALLEMTGVNLFIWSLNRFIREGGTLHEFRVGFDSWGENYKNGMEWDDNNFITNQFAHPYQGSAYFNAARANGYDFWNSIPFAFLGSYQWEYFFETNHASVNDWIATSVGGVSLGEVFYRLSDMVLNNESTGGGRAARELAGFGINPVRGFNRLVTGRAFKVHANPPDDTPEHLGVYIELGERWLGKNRVWDNPDSRGFFNLAMKYGDAFEGVREKPFDVFDFELRLDFRDADSINRFKVNGLLFGAEVSSSPAARHILGSSLHYEYIINPAFEYGEQSVGATFLSQFQSKSHPSTIRAELNTNVILLGAAKSPYKSFTGRDYDYGSGFGATIKAMLRIKDRDYISISHQEHYVYILNGTKGNYHITFTRFRFDVPIVDWLGVGSDYTLYTSDGRFDDYPDVKERSPEVRVFLSWAID